MQVRARKRCFVAESLREEGDIFDVPEGTKLFSKGKKNDPVLELVGGEAAKKSPPPKRGRPGATDEPDGDD